MLSTTIPQDIQVLQQLLLDETQIKEQALAKVDALEREISALKSVLGGRSLESPQQTNPVPPGRTFNGELVLIVDDQRLNLDLVASLLEDENLTIVSKPSAIEALEYLRSAEPALILMDIQMPQMDGYCATEKIRAEFSQLNPIILAMTANDTDEDRQKSLNAGMQGHICKPIDAEYLLDQLEYWLNKRRTVSNKLGPDIPVDQTAPFASPINPIGPGDETLPGIDLPSAMARLRGNSTLLQEVLVSFAEKAALIIPELRQALAEHNSIETTRILHRLKGTSANLSAYKIAPLAALLESQCKAGQMPTEEELLQLDAAVNEIISTALRLGQTKDTPQPSLQAVTRAQLEPFLQRIAATLHSDLGQAEEAIEQLCKCCAHSIWAEHAAQLRTLFYQFNLRAVHELVSQGFKDSSS